jgi:hypothetical protein
MYIYNFLADELTFTNKGGRMKRKSNPFYPCNNKKKPEKIC